MKQQSTILPGIKIDRAFKIDDKRILRFEQTYSIAHRYSSPIASGKFWIYARVEKSRGSITFIRSPSDVYVVGESSFWLILPPLSLIAVIAENAEFTASGFLAPSSDVTLRLPPGAFIPETSPDSVANKNPETIDDLLEIYQHRQRSDISHTDVSLAIEKAKEFLDANYRKSPSMQQIGVAVGMSPSALTRAFKRELYITPLRYRLRLQMMDALTQILKGSDILAASLESGFADLSRFYKNFKEFLHTTPGNYQGKE